MRRFFKVVLWGVVGIMILTGCNTIGGEDKGNTNGMKKEEILVSAAASLKESMEQIKTIYEGEHPEVTLTFNFGSSGALQQQIEQGAPADVFISAAEKQMDALEDKNLIIKASRKDLLENKVVLITPADKTDINSFEDVVTDKVGQIGLGEPGSVPVGQYAEEVFTNLGILDKVKAKAVYAKDVKEVLAWVETGNVDAGVVYATDAKASDYVNIIGEAPVGTYKAAIYPVAVIKDSKNQEAAEGFVQFLNSDSSREIFEMLGFSVK